MRVNNVVTNMRSGRMSYGCNLSFPSSTLVELAGRAGFDFVTFDSEHGPFTPDSFLLLDMLRSVAHVDQLAHRRSDPRNA